MHWFIAQAEGEENGQPAPQPEYTLSKGMSIPEALQIMNFKREEVNATNLSEVDLLLFFFY